MKYYEKAIAISCFVRWKAVSNRRAYDEYVNMFGTEPFPKLIETEWRICAWVN